MDTTKTVAHNALWNWAGMAVHMLIGFLIAPFLVSHLGDSTYGLWIVIASLTSYFGVFDLGVGGSVGRNVAFFRARNDLAGVNGILSTAFFYLCSVATLALLATIGAIILFFQIIDVAPDQADAARLAIVFVGLNFALALPLQSFDGILWAYQRFDIQNGVDIPAVLVRAGLTFWLVGTGHGLVALALITLFTSLGALTLKAALTLRIEPGLRVRWSLLNRDSAKGLFGYGIWYFLFSLIKTLAPQVMLTIVGSRLGTALVTPFTVAARLVGYANQFIIAGTGVVTPVATALHACDDQKRQQELLIVGGRACLALSLVFLCLFATLGQSLISLWMGPLLAFAYPLLLILALGEVLPMSQHITFGMILGKGRLGILAVSSLVEIAASSTAALILTALGYGLTEVCVAVAIPAVICRGVSPMVHACRAVGVPVSIYVWRSLIPGILAVAGPGLVFGWITLNWQPANWPELLGAGAAYAAVAIGFAGVALFGIEPWRALMRRRLESHRPSANVEPAPTNPELADATKS